MHRILGVFLLSVSTVAAVGQQPNSVLNDHLSPEIAQTASSELVGQAGQPAVPKTHTVLPDAPSYSGHSQSEASSVQPSPMAEALAGSPGVNLRATNGAVPSDGHPNAEVPDSGRRSAFVFDGRSTAASDDGSQATEDSATNGRCNSVETAQGSGWFSTLVSRSMKGGGYCPLGEGGIWKRGTHAILSVHKYDETNAFNMYPAYGDITGTGLPLGYPYGNYAGDRLAARYASTIGRDALRNVFREFWPDVSNYMTRRHPSSGNSQSSSAE